jgi:hypothetical protein
VSCLVDNSVLFDETNLATDKSVIIDMSQIDRLSVQITVFAFTSGLPDFPMISLNESVDGINFTQVANLTFLTVGVTIWHIAPIFSQFKKILYQARNGSGTFKVQINAHNDTITSFGGKVNTVFGVS